MNIFFIFVFYKLVEVTPRPQCGEVGK